MKYEKLFVCFFLSVHRVSKTVYLYIVDHSMDVNTTMDWSNVCMEYTHWCFLDFTLFACNLLHFHKP